MYIFQGMTRVAVTLVTLCLLVVLWGFFKETGEAMWLHSHRTRLNALSMNSDSDLLMLNYHD